MRNELKPGYWALPLPEHVVHHADRAIGLILAVGVFLHTAPPRELQLARLGQRRQPQDRAFRVTPAAR